MSFSNFINYFFEYETPRVVTIRNVPLGILRLVLQFAVLTFVLAFQLGYRKGYQITGNAESSVTTKVKGISYSSLSQNHNLFNLSEEKQSWYERVWDAVDYVIPPSENSGFFVLTNLVITPNQTRDTCPENHEEFPDSVCNMAKGGYPDTVPPAWKNESHHSNSDTSNINNICIKGRIRRYGSHGMETGRCIKTQQAGSSGEDVSVCEISGWCPVELDILPMPDRPLIPNTEYFTVMIKNSISFTTFHLELYRRNNMPHGICMFDPNNSDTWLCPIFRLGDIVGLAGGNYSQLAIKGAVIGIEIMWHCDLDWDFMEYCLPKYYFSILDSSGWNFRYSHYLEENRRTLIKAYGMKFLINVSSKGGMFDVTKTTIIVVTGLGMIGLANLLCDFVLLKCSHKHRDQVVEKKYERINMVSMLASNPMLGTQPRASKRNGARRRPMSTSDIGLHRKKSVIPPIDMSKDHSCNNSAKSYASKATENHEVSV